MYRYFIKKYYPFVIIIFLIITNISSYCYFNRQTTAKVKSKPVSIVTQVEPDTNLITVDIKGEVKKPGLYQLTSGSNVNDLIKLAGGIKKTGTTNNINLARILTNQSVIVIKKKNAVSSEVVEIPCVTKEVELSNCNNNSIIEIEKSDNNEGESKVVVEETNNDNNKIHINTASVKELMSLSGIGEAKAKNIIEYRATNGLFTSIDDLKKISGISETIFNKIKDFIEL